MPIGAACLHCHFQRNQLEDDRYLCGPLDENEQEVVRGHYGTWKSCSRRKKLGGMLVKEAKKAREDSIWEPMVAKAG